MTLDLAGGGNIDGRSFASLGLLLIKSNIPLLPDIRQAEEEIPGQDGLLDLETKFGARPIELTVEFAEDHEVDYQVRLSELAALLNPVTKREILLVLKRMPAKQWRVKYNGTLPIDKISTLGTFTIPFKAYYPFAESVVNASEPPDLGDGLTLGLGYQLGGALQTAFVVNASPITFTVKNLGNYDAYPLITLNGSASSLTVKNETTGEQFSFNTPITGTTVMNTNVKELSIRQNGLNIFHLMSGDFPKLASGDNNFKVTATNPNLTISFDYKHVYLY